MAKFKFRSLNLNAYFYDSVDGYVYSTKRKGAPYRMTWSNQSGNYYVSLMQGCLKVIIRKNQIRNYLEHTPYDVSPVESSSPVPSIVSGFIVGSVNGAVYSIAAVPKIHPTMVVAKLEAERLAKATPGKEYLVLAIMGSVKASGVTWK